MRKKADLSAHVFSRSRARSATPRSVKRSIFFLLDGDDFFRHTSLAKEFERKGLWEEFGCCWGLEVKGYAFCFDLACTKFLAQVFPIRYTESKKGSRKYMKEIIVKNELGIRVLINGIPNLQNIPKEIADSFIAALETEISEFYKTFSERYSTNAHPFFPLWHYEVANVKT